MCPEPSKMERIIKDFRIANNLSPMESIQQLNRPGGLWWDFDLLPLGDLSLALLIEIVPRNQISMPLPCACNLPLSSKVGDANVALILHQPKKLFLLTWKLFKCNFYTGSEY